jgi:4-hydroxy-tetrahydrodipicolinate synthase
MLLPEGLITSSYTPFADDYSLDVKTLRARLESVTEGATAINGPMGHGEIASLTFEEWQTWTDILMDVAREAHLQPWSFFGAESFEKTIHYANHALKAGAVGFVVLAPYFNEYGQEAACVYFRDLAKKYSDTPIIFYPSSQTGNQFSPATIARLAEVPNIVGMKLNGADTFYTIAEIIRLTRDIRDFRIVAGGYDTLYPLLRDIGIKATFSPSSAYAPDWSLRLWKAYQERDWKTADMLGQKLTRVTKAMLPPGGGHIGAHAGHKAAMGLLGKPVGLARRPGMPVTAEHLAQIRKALQEEGLL